MDHLFSQLIEKSKIGTLDGVVAFRQNNSITKMKKKVSTEQTRNSLYFSRSKTNFKDSVNRLAIKNSARCRRSEFDKKRNELRVALAVPISAFFHASKLRIDFFQLKTLKIVLLL